MSYHQISNKSFLFLILIWKYNKMVHAHLPVRWHSICNSPCLLFLTVTQHPSQETEVQHIGETAQSQAGKWQTDKASYFSEATESPGPLNHISFRLQSNQRSREALLPSPGSALHREHPRQYLQPLVCGCCDARAPQDSKGGRWTPGAAWRDGDWQAKLSLLNNSTCQTAPLDDFLAALTILWRKFQEQKRRCSFPPAPSNLRIGISCSLRVKGSQCGQKRWGLWDPCPWGQ